MKPADGASSWRKRNQRLQEEIERLRKELEARATRRPSPSGSFAGTSGFDKLKPIKKFTDRKAATTRIWEAIQNLRAAPASKGHTVAARRRQACEESQCFSRRRPSTAPNASTPRVPRAFSEQTIVPDVLNPPWRASGWATSRSFGVTPTGRGFPSA